eukprot:COSAG02_NODE_9102_length_2330_cov_1.977589_1_plen_87_part_00
MPARARVVRSSGTSRCVVSLAACKPQGWTTHCSLPAYHAPWACAAPALATCSLRTRSPRSLLVVLLPDVGETASRSWRCASCVSGR